jgi:FkbH-like protein
MTTVREILASVTGAPASYAAAANALSKQEWPELRSLRVAVLSSFTAEFLKSYLVVEGARRGVAVKPFWGPYGQFEQQVFDPASPLFQSSPDIVFLNMAIEDVAPQLCEPFLTLNEEGVEKENEAIVTRLAALMRKFRETSSARILVSNFSLRGEFSAGFADAALALGQAAAFAALNRKLAVACTEISDAYVFDLAALMNDVGRRNWTDSRLQYFARAPLSAVALRAMSERLGRYLSALIASPRKCLVLDLDNTLWGGVLGEDGMEGIKLGEDWPGSAFKAFQRKCLALRDRGILLAVASKNDESLAIEALERHPDCLIRGRHLSCHRISWNDKATSLREIAAELNIGVASLVFFDDNPVERDWVRQNCPEVMVVDVPADPLGYIAALEESGAFDQLVLTADDRQRAAMYAAEVQRKVLVQGTTSVEDFLRQLDMKVRLGPFRGDVLPRVAQLIGKTNQFNLTGYRRSAADLQDALKAGGVGLWIRVADRFGDNGLVGVALAIPENGEDWRLDLFLLSCRIIGRRIENTLLTVIAEFVRAKGGKRIVGEYIPTARNGMAANFLSNAGFAKLSDGRWVLDVSADAPLRSDLIDIEVDEPDYV